MTFCNDCGKPIEWHKTAAGRDMPIDPEPVPEGRYYFDKVRLVFAAPGTRPKMYASHFDTCAKRKPRAPRVCFGCGKPGHLRADCPDDPGDHPNDPDDGWGQQ